MRYLLVAIMAGLGLAAGLRGGAPERSIELWHIQTYAPTKAAVGSAVEQAEAANPGLTVKAEANENDAFKTKLAAALGANSAPDVFHTWGGGVLAAYARNKRVLDLTDRFPNIQERFLPAALDFCKVEGRLYALPVDVSFVPVYYNTELFAKHGLKPPTTIPEWFALCDKLKAAQVTPLALGNAAGWPGAFYFAYFATRAGGTEPITRQAFAHQSFVEAGRLVQQMVAAGYFSKGLNGLKYDDALRQFFNGEAAMILMGTWLPAKAQDMAPAMLPKLGTFSFPGLGQNAEWDRVLLGGVNAAYAVSAATRYPDDAAALLTALSSDESLKEWTATGRIPALNRETARAVLGKEPEGAAVLYGAGAIQLYYDQLLPPALGAAHKETTQALFAQTMTPAAAAEKMAAAAAKQR